MTYEKQQSDGNVNKECKMATNNNTCVEKGC